MTDCRQQQGIDFQEISGNLEASEMMSEFVYVWEQDGSPIKFSWLGSIDVKPDRVYAIAFTPDSKILLVTDTKWRPACWLPGGGLEVGETPQQALSRELKEEANADMQQLVKIGVQCAENAAGDKSYQAFYWCRVIVNNQFSPRHEVTERRLVTPETFLDTLFWGRKDPKAPILLERALEIEQSRS